MPDANIFRTILKGEIGNARRVFHSATNYFSSIDRSSFGFGNASSQVLNTAGNVGGTLGGIAGVATIAGATVATGAFLAAVAGPQVAITGAVIGLAMLAKGAYSNREAAHKKLQEYTWTMLDDVAPKPFDSMQTLEDVAEAAMTLLEDGKNQVKLLGTKLQAAQVKFALTNAAIVDASTRYEAAKRNAGSSIESVRKGAMEDLKRIKESTMKLWEKETKSGGSIFEYVRRCVHTGNYLQAPLIMSIAMKEKQKRGGATTTGGTAPAIAAQADYFSDWPAITDLRESFKKLEAEYRKCLTAIAP